MGCGQGRSEDPQDQYKERITKAKEMVSKGCVKASDDFEIHQPP